MVEGGGGGGGLGWGGVGWGRGRGNVSSRTIPTPNQPLFIRFSLPINVIHGN